MDIAREPPQLWPAGGHLSIRGGKSREMIESQQWVPEAAASRLNKSQPQTDFALRIFGVFLESCYIQV